MMTMKSKFNGPAAEAHVLHATWESLMRAVEFLWKELVTVVLAKTNPRPYKTPSLPGEPPRLRTGWLRTHVVREYNPYTLEARVGVTKNAIYGLFLELGTSRMAARPWLLSTVMRLMPQMQAMVKPP